MLRLSRSQSGRSLEQLQELFKQIKTFIDDGECINDIHKHLEDARNGTAHKFSKPPIVDKQTIQMAMYLLRMNNV